MRDVCVEILTSYRIKKWLPFVDGYVGIGGLVIGLVYVINTFATIYLVYRNKNLALQGMVGVSKYVIFPVYLPFLWGSALTDFAVGLMFLFLKVEVYKPNSWLASFAIALIIALQHIILEGISFALMQYGCGLQAARKSFKYSIIWGIVTYFFMVFSFRRGGTGLAYTLSAIWGTIMCTFYISLFLLPDKYLFRRPAIKVYAKFWALFRFIVLFADILMWYSDTHSDYITPSEIANCTYGFAGLIIFALFKPYIVYRTLLEDSKWWQGILSNSGSNMNNNNDGYRYSEIFSKFNYFWSSNKYERVANDAKLNETSLQNPLVGIEVGFTEAQDLAQEVDNLISDSNVRLLNFAFISLEENNKLGSGSFSKVYLGKYKTSIVAIKLLFTSDLNIEIVRRVCNEANILSHFTSQNIVKIYGVSVLPPSICIILEYCKYGSLSDVLRGSIDASTGICKFPLSLSLSDRMYLALGCARGLQALHEYSINLCHRDVKSFNFLVDADLNVKIADLELSSINYNKDNSDGYYDFSCIIEDGMLILWQAPEVLNGEEYTQSADIYSLAIVLWEIITTRYKSIESNNSDFNDYNLPFYEFSTRQSDIIRMITTGIRPSINSIHNSLSNPIYAEYIDLMSRGWAEDKNKRPSASEVVRIMENCWKSCCYQYIQTSKVNINFDTLYNYYTIKNKYKADLTVSSVKESEEALYASLAPLQLEVGWEKLNADGAYLVVTPTSPHVIMWCTRKWAQLFDYLLNDILGNDLTFLFGILTKTDQLYKSIGKDSCDHLMIYLYKSDGSPMILSLHTFPIFKSTSGNNTIDTNTITSNDNTVVASSLSSSCTTIANTRDDGWNVTSSYDDNDMIEKIVNTSSPSSPKKTFISNMYESINPKSKYENNKNRNNVAYVIIQFSVI
jgi:hypothetical protein